MAAPAVELGVEAATAKQEEDRDGQELDVSDSREGGCLGAGVPLQQGARVLASPGMKDMDYACAHGDNQIW